MKKFLLLLVASLTMLFWGCTQFDDSRIWDAIDELEDLYDDLDGRVEDLEEACEKMNTNIEALQTLVSALQNNDTITSIAPIKQGDKVVGYTITFSKSEPITIYHGNDGKDGANGADGQDGANGADGKDGKDGYTPQIGVAKDSDNVYYWTLDGEWLLDEGGNKIKAVGTDGKDGEDGADGADGSNGEDGKDGENGTDGKDGENGITPQLEIREGYWWISYDNGATWKELGKATGEDGKDGADGEDGANGSDGKDGADGDSLFESVTWDDEYAYFTLADGTTIKIPLSEGAVSEVLDVNINHFYGEYYGEGFHNGTYVYVVAISDVYDIITESFDNEDGNANLYMFFLFSDTAAYTLPNGTYRFDNNQSGEVNTICAAEDVVYSGMRNWESYTYERADGVVTISDNKLEATFIFENGEKHHVVYDGSLKLGESVEDDPTIPNKEIYYTSTDGNIVIPSSYAFGVNILSNIYEDGNGVITIDGDATEFGDNAFSNSFSLTSVTIPDSVTSIGWGAFSYCTSLTSITIPDSVTEIGDCAFEYCTSLTSITIPEGVTSIGERAFEGCSSLTSITIPESVTRIEYGAFDGCIGELIINSKMVEERDPFYGWLYFSEVTIGENIEKIGSYTFHGWPNLVSVTIPDSVTSIGSYAFQNCKSLASITIPDSVTEIEWGAFEGCSSLAEVYCKPTTPPTAIEHEDFGEWDGFDGAAPNITIYVPTESVEAYKAANYWSDYADAIVGYDFE